MSISGRCRRGFTIVELLVSMALIMMIMAILSQAFVSGLETFSSLRATADMSQKLRSATATLRRDLTAYHFDGVIRPSDPGFGTTVIPREGFIRIYMSSAPTLEGKDSYSYPSYRGTTQVLHMAVKLRGNRPEDFFVANLPSGGTANTTLMTSSTFFSQPPDARYQTQPTQYYGQWAEVMYFLVPLTDNSGNAISSGPVGTGQPLYALYRVERPTIANSTAQGLAGQGTSYSTCMSINPTNNNFNTSADLITPTSRSLNPTNPTAAGAPPLSNLMLNNVVSFCVRPITIGSSSTSPAPQQAKKYRTYDTASPTFQLYGIEISIRVWDTKSQQTRQITLTQDL